MKKILPIIATVLAVSFFVCKVHLVSNFLKDNNIIEKVEVLILQNEMDDLKKDLGDFNFGYIFRDRNFFSSDSQRLRYFLGLKNNVEQTLDIHSTLLYTPEDMVFGRGSNLLYFKDALDNFQGYSLKESLSRMKALGVQNYFEISFDFYSVKQYNDFVNNHKNLKKLIGLKKLMEKYFNTRVILSFKKDYLENMSCKKVKYIRKTLSKTLSLNNNLNMYLSKFELKTYSFFQLFNFNRNATILSFSDY